VRADPNPVEAPADIYDLADILFAQTKGAGARGGAVDEQLDCRIAERLRHLQREIGRRRRQRFESPKEFALCVQRFSARRQDGDIGRGGQKARQFRRDFRNYGFAAVEQQ
jgi:hypothetical protein